MTEQESTELAAEIGVENNAPENFFIVMLTGSKESVRAKKLLVQKILRQLVEGYGFSRSDLETDDKPQIPGYRRKRVDIATFELDTEYAIENLKLLVVFTKQKSRDKLGTYAKMEEDAQSSQALMELLPNVSLGMWTNEQEEFIVRIEHARFITKLIIDEEVVERTRHGERVEIRRTVRRGRHIHDELPLVAKKNKEFCETGEVAL